MEKVLVFSLLVVASLRSASTEEKFFKEGGSVTLDLWPAFSDRITIIQWKYKDSILAEWVEGVLPLTHNRDNIKLDRVSGRLAMEKMTKPDEGVYSVEVNSNVQKVTYNVVLIKDVPKPKIWISPLTCSEESDQCTLKCDGDTTGAEPVTYSWKTDNGEWKESRRDMPITKKQHGQVKTFTCKMKNPVGEKESDLFTNRLYRKGEPKPSPVGGIVGGIVGAILVVIMVGGAIWVWKKKKLPCGKRIIDPESPDKNGTVPASSDDPNVVLLGGISTTNTSPGATPGSQAGPAGGADPSNPPPEEAPPEASRDKEPGSEDALTGEPADPPNTPREEDAAGEADAEAGVKP